MRFEIPEQIFATTIMIRNYFKIAWRNLLKHKTNNFLNIAGLALGVACCLLISFYVTEELSYDKGFKDSDSIYRITRENFGDNAKHWAATAPPLASSIKEYLPEVSEVTRLSYVNTRVLSSSDKKFEEKDGYYADANFLSVFGMKLEHGDTGKALADVNTIVLTTPMAKKYFGDKEPIGQMIKMVHGGDEILLRVTGVFEPVPFNTHFKFDYLVSMPTMNNVVGDAMNSKTWSGFYTYVKVREDASLKAMEAKVPSFLLKFYADQGKSEKQILADGTIHFQPISDIHLHSKLEKEMTPNGDIRYVYIFSFTALLILFIACINFINLSTVQALKRIKEIGVRKTIGASRKGLIGQFLSETILQTLISVILAIVLFWIALPYYQLITGKVVVFQQIFSPFYMLLLGGMTVVVGLLSGLYPAYFASGFEPVAALKGKKNSDLSVGILRKGLITLQFAVSVFLIASTIIIYQQMKLFSNTNLGFDKEQVIAVKLLGDLQYKAASNPDLMKEELLKNPAILNAALTSRLPGERLGTDDFDLNDKSLAITNTDIRVMWADENYLSTLGINITQGRNFIKNDLKSGSMTFIVNESAVKKLNLQSPVGQKASMQGAPGTIVGVVNDFNFASLHQSVEPLVILYDPTQSGYLLVKTKGSNVPNVLSFLKSKIGAVSPSSLFNYSFLDDNLDALYASESRTATILNVFTAFAILISCLGLFGLSSYTAKLRFKEIGIRKVLGASEGSLISLLTKDFLILVVIALFIGSPLCWWIMQSWLQGFAYRVEIQWWVFLLAGITAIMVAFITVSFQATKAALMNPVKSLGAE